VSIHDLTPLEVAVVEVNNATKLIAIQVLHIIGSAHMDK